MNRRISVCCPYCGVSNSVAVTSDYNDAAVVVCDVIEGGCDRMFVAYISVALSAKALMIEGESDKDAAHLAGEVD